MRIFKASLSDFFLVSAKTVKNCQKLEIKMMSGSGAEGLGAVVVKCTAPGKSTLFISTFPTSPLSLSSSDHIQHFQHQLHFSGLDIKPSRARQKNTARLRHGPVIAGNCETVK